MGEGLLVALEQVSLPPCRAGSLDVDVVVIDEETVRRAYFQAGTRHFEGLQVGHEGLDLHGVKAEPGTDLRPHLRLADRPDGTGSPDIVKLLVRASRQ
ncbi:hypothetical protein ACH40F_51705 [Streptomyces sp. NPDC020794]|uniref:hypothetical protein n=1 Tax=unclassified Streptomyces TaxID=2593676 RepID=UPI0036EE6624